MVLSRYWSSLEAIEPVMDESSLLEMDPPGVREPPRFWAVEVSGKVGWRRGEMLPWLGSNGPTEGEVILAVVASAVAAAGWELTWALIIVFERCKE